METGMCKTTLYFDPTLYMIVKQKALSEGKTITEYLGEIVKCGVGERKIKQGKFRSKMPKLVNLGKISGSLRREEIYDFV